MYTLIIDKDWELDRKSITLRNQLGIGEFGPIYDAELELRVNAVSRVVVKVNTHYKHDIEYTSSSHATGISTRYISRFSSLQRRG